MADFLRRTQSDLPEKPSAIVVVSGHWETHGVRVTTAHAPTLLYDYSGFPAHTYKLTYPAPGDPALAREIVATLGRNGIAAQGDPARGFDHGVFIPFLLAFPEAEIPVIEVSLPLSATPEDAFALGRALSPLRARNVLIVGTGMTYHNLRHFLDDNPVHNARARAFDDWLRDAVETDPTSRDAHLAAWESAPYAREAHPEPEHLMPLLFAAGAAGDDRGVRTFNDPVIGKPQSAFRFG